MLAIVEYTDNTMENYKIICAHKDFRILEERLYNLRNLNKYSNIKSIYRIIRI